MEEIAQLKHCTVTSAVAIHQHSFSSFSSYGLGMCKQAMYAWFGASFSSFLNEQMHFGKGGFFLSFFLFRFYFRKVFGQSVDWSVDKWTEREGEGGKR